MFLHSLHSMRTPVLVLDHGYWSTQAGLPEFAHGWAITDVVWADRRETGRALESEIRDAITQQRFATIVLDDERSWFFKDIDQHYRRNGRDHRPGPSQRSRPAASVRLRAVSGQFLTSDFQLPTPTSNSQLPTPNLPNPNFQIPTSKRHLQPPDGSGLGQSGFVFRISVARILIELGILVEDWIVRSIKDPDASKHSQAKVRFLQLAQRDVPLRSLVLRTRPVVRLFVVRAGGHAAVGNLIRKCLGQWAVEPQNCTSRTIITAKFSSLSRRS